MKPNWVKIMWNSKNGWTDHIWGCRATWWWSIKRVLPYPKNYRLMWRLVGSCYEKRGIHFVQATGSCMTCMNRFDNYDARAHGYKMLNTWIRPAQSWYEDVGKEEWEWRYKFLE